jgi:hypothetical protein
VAVAFSPKVSGGQGAGRFSSRERVTEWSNGGCCCHSEGVWGTGHCWQCVVSEKEHEPAAEKVEVVDILCRTMRYSCTS